MGMETLNNAARAAGYAMATSDDLLNDSKPEARPEIEAWRPGEAIMASQPATVIRATRCIPSPTG